MLLIRNRFIRGLAVLMTILASAGLALSAFAILVMISARLIYGAQTVAGWPGIGAGVVLFVLFVGVPFAGYLALVVGALISQHLSRQT